MIDIDDRQDPLGARLNHAVERSFLRFRNSAHSWNEILYGWDLA
jgi:hypothetical protein